MKGNLQKDDILMIEKIEGKKVTIVVIRDLEIHGCTRRLPSFFIQLKRATTQMDYVLKSLLTH